MSIWEEEMVSSNQIHRVVLEGRTISSTWPSEQDNCRRFPVTPSQVHQADSVDTYQDDHLDDHQEEWVKGMEQHILSTSKGVATEQLNWKDHDLETNRKTIFADWVYKMRSGDVLIAPLNLSSPPHQASQEQGKEGTFVEGQKWSEVLAKAKDRDRKGDGDGQYTDITNELGLDDVFSALSSPSLTLHQALARKHDGKPKGKSNNNFTNTFWS